jgi:hypothetical protein
LTGGALDNSAVSPRFVIGWVAHRLA